MGLIITGNLKSLAMDTDRKERRFAYAARLWLIGDVGEAIGFWVLHKCKFRRIVKPLLLRYRQGRMKTTSHFISPNQIRQGQCYLPSEDELVYNNVFSEEQKKYSFSAWDFLAIKVQKERSKLVSYPCLIDVKTRRGEAKTSRDYESFKKRDFSREKKLGFRVFCLRVILHDNWRFEAELEEL